MTDVTSSAVRGATMVAVAPAGRINSVPSPLATPPLAWISSVIATVSTATWKRASHSTDGQRRWSTWIETRPNAK